MRRPLRSGLIIVEARGIETRQAPPWATGTVAAAGPPSSIWIFDSLTGDLLALTDEGVR